MSRLEAHLSPTLAGSLRHFLASITTLPDTEQEEVVEALAAGLYWHAFQRRKSGPLYSAHVLQTATLVARTSGDPVAIQAALLHDTLEDTPATAQEIEQRFSEEVRRMVEAVSKHPTSSEKEFLEKVYARAADDARVGIIKIADRIANLSHDSIAVFTPERQQTFVAETQHYYLDKLCLLPGIPPRLTALLTKLTNQALIARQ